jgi:hypothetical protein
VPSDGFGAIICPDSKTFAAYDDAAMKWFVSSSGPNGSTPKSSVIESVEGLAKSNGCHYIGPETSLVSEGGNPIGSLAIVTAQMPDGTTIRGVTFPTMITQNQQLDEATQQVQVQASNLPADGSEAPQEPKPAPVKNPNPPAQEASIAEIDQQAIELWNQKRYSDALPLFNRACSAREADACHYLGVMFEFGHGVAQDFSRTRELYLKACQAGDRPACSDLGILQDYEPDLLQCKSTTLTIMVNRYTESCIGGDGASCSTLAHLYSYGCGIAKDADKARQLYSKACTAGNQQGCDRLKEMQ